MGIPLALQSTAVLGGGSVTDLPTLADPGSVADEKSRTLAIGQEVGMSLGRVQDLPGVCA